MMTKNFKGSYPSLYTLEECLEAANKATQGLPTVTHENAAQLLYIFLKHKHECGGEVSDRTRRIIQTLYGVTMCGPLKVG